MLRLGPFGCAGEGEMIIAVFSLRQSVSSVLRGFGGRLAHRVLHSVDVLFGHRALRALAGAATAAFRRCGR